MADTNKEKLVEKLTNIADGFRTSRSLTETLSLDDMATLAAVPIGGGDNKLAQFVNNTITEITAQDLEGITNIRAYILAYSAVETFEIPSTIQTIEKQAWTQANALSTVKYDGTTGDWASLPKKSNQDIPTASYLPNLDTMWFRNSEGEYYMVDDTLEITPGTTIIEQFSFYQFTRPRNIIIPSSVIKIGNSAFYQCSNVINLTLNEGLEQIATQAFRLQAFQNVVVPNSVIRIETRAFGDNDSLNEVRIGNGIGRNDMSSSAFAKCPNLTDIYIDKPEGDVSNAPWGATNATVHWNTPLPTN